MSFGSIWKSIHSEWRDTSPLKRIVILIGVMSGLIAMIRFTWEFRPWNPRIPPPLRSEVPAYFDVDDLGQYTKWGIDTGTAGRIAALLRTENQLDEARELLLDLRERVTTRPAIDFVNGLITATWYGQEEHRQGLEFLGEITERLPPNDFRYRFQFHAHLRAVARREGIQAAEKLVDRMRRKHRRVEYTRVWLGIPLANMVALYHGADHAESVDFLEDSDRDYLIRLTQEIPGDPFIDHALFVLQDYERVVREHRNSLLRSTAMQLWIYETVDCASNSAECRVVEAHARLAQLGADYPTLLRDTRVRAASYLAKAGRIRDAEEVGCAGSVDCADARETILRAALHSHLARAVDVVEWLARAEPRLLERRLDDVLLALDDAPRLVQVRDYAGALASLDRCSKAMALHGITPSPMFLRRREALQKLEAASTRGGADGYFELGLAEANAAKIGQSVDFANILRNNAAESFGHVRQLAPGTELAARASYLRAAAYRRMQNYDASLAEIDHFLDTYHSSPLYDDMLAEKGVHFVNVGKARAESDEIFADIANNYSVDNAADNALTWMARTRVQDCRFADALSIYERIAQDYPASRLGLRAREQALALIPVVRTRTYRNAVPGLTISSFPSRQGAHIVDVRRGSVADAVNMAAGDVILAVGDQDVSDAATYYKAMSWYRPGMLMRLTVRGSDRERYVTVGVSSTDHYAITPLGVSCPD